MTHEYTATAATLEEATELAKKGLGAPETAEVKIEILAMPKKKTLGLFGGSPAKVRAYYEAADEVKAEPKVKNESKGNAKAKTKPAKSETKAFAQEKAPKKAKSETKPEIKSEENKAEFETTTAADEISTPVDIKSSKSLTVAAEYLTKVITGMGAQSVSVEAYRTQDDEIILEIDCGEDYGVVIGRRGETLDSIQYLTRLVANKHKAENEYVRISVNVGSYREKRRNTLRELAKKNSEKVLKYGRNVTFEPMNPYERRIIHTAVQEIEGVTSHSVGSDSARRVVITLAEGVKPTHPSKGGYNNRGRGGKGGYNRGGRGGRSNSAPRSDAPARAPRTDAGAEKVSLYGKIN